jgi:hypothetical protein
VEFATGHPHQRQGRDLASATKSTAGVVSVQEAKKTAFDSSIAQLIDDENFAVYRTHGALSLSATLMPL